MPPTHEASREVLEQLSFAIERLEQQARALMDETAVQQQGRRRFTAACAAMQGLLSDPEWCVPLAQAATVSVEYADALLAELDKAESEQS